MRFLHFITIHYEWKFRQRQKIPNCGHITLNVASDKSEEEEVFSNVLMLDLMQLLMVTRQSEDYVVQNLFLFSFLFPKLPVICVNHFWKTVRDHDSFYQGRKTV